MDSGIRKDPPYGFCKQVFRELPMELAVEAQKLLGVSLEGSVG
jgi:Fe-S cluster assembly protein SufB